MTWLARTHPRDNLPNMAAASPRETIDLSDGETLVFHADGTGGLTLVARIKTEQWSTMQPRNRALCRIVATRGDQASSNAVVTPNCVTSPLCSPNSGVCLVQGVSAGCA